MNKQTDPFLTGNFAPVAEECTSEELPVVGEIPSNLNGWFIRNGPNPQYPPQGNYHWFDGDGMLHGVEISQGKALYRNRYVKTEGFKAENEAGKAIYGGLLEPGNSYKNVSNTALIWHHRKLLSLWEGGEPYHIQLPSLDTLGLETFDSKLNIPFSAHPKVDPMTQEMMFIGYNMFQPPFLQYGIVGSDGEIKQIIPIELPIGVMMHDFAITENYTLFLNLPLTCSGKRIAQGKPPIQFEPETSSYFGVLPRHGQAEDIRWFEANSCYIFHTLNAYESENEIVLLACGMRKTNIFGEINNPESNPLDYLPFLTKWRLNLSSQTLIEEKLDQRPSEFPRINEQYLGRAIRYGYTASMSPSPLPLFDGVIKYDFKTGESWQHQYGVGRYGGEVVFAPNPQGKDEDDGWLITFVYDESTYKSELVILNAQNLTNQAIARIQLPDRVPYGFHGIWIDNAPR